MILITGANGQDGQILTHLLSKRGEQVVAVVSPTSQVTEHFMNLPGVNVVRANRFDFLNLDELPERDFSVFVHLAGSSSVADSLINPLRTMRINNSLAMEAVEFAVRRQIPFVFASSSEVFSRESGYADEHTEHNPFTPYGFSKSKIAELIDFYRKRELLQASILTMFNHESPLRPEKYLTKTIARQVISILRGEANSMNLMSLGASKDFSWAPDFVALLAHPKLWLSNKDFVLGSGKATSALSLATAALSRCKVDVQLNETGENRDRDVHPVADSKLANDSFNWSVTFSAESFMERYIDFELSALEIEVSARPDFFAALLARDAAEVLERLR